MANSTERPYQIATSPWHETLFVLRSSLRTWHVVQSTHSS